MLYIIAFSIIFFRITAILSLSIIILLDFSLLKSVVIREFFDLIKYLDSLRTSFKKVFTIKNIVAGERLKKNLVNRNYQR